jgi:hypothetical protein
VQRDSVLLTYSGQAYDAMNQTQMNSSEFGPQRHNAATTEEQKQVLKGTDIVPIQLVQV